MKVRPLVVCGSSTNAMVGTVTIYVDADACPVKQEVYRVAERHGLKVFVVSNSPISIPHDPLIERIVVAAGMDAADDWIAERATKGAIVVTQDIPLATRNLMDSLRSAGEITGGPKPFAPKDRSAFLQSLDREIVRLKRAGFA